MTAIVMQGDARRLPLTDDSVDLIVTSPPYWGLRSYQDGGEHYDGQIGAEATPAEYVDALIDCTREWMRVLKPEASLWLNLGDKYGPDKSLLGLPWQYALACREKLGLILRAEVIWDKPSALPESVNDRVRRSHETWFHLVQQRHYFTAIDEIREPASDYSRPNGNGRQARGGQKPRLMTDTCNPLGRLPGSVWEIATQPLTVPAELGVDHFAAFPLEWPRRIITGWSPSGICTACGDGRMPNTGARTLKDSSDGAEYTSTRYAPDQPGAARRGGNPGSTLRHVTQKFITGYTCACPDATAPTRPATVLDPFGGTGTTSLVADALGRTGISIDASRDYCRIARWRTTDPGERARALGVSKPRQELPGQQALFDLETTS